MKKKNSLFQKKSFKIFAITFLSLIVLICGVAIYQTFFSSSNLITVNGQAVEQVSPDVVSVYFNVETEAQTSGEAEDENSKIVQELRNKLVSLGFEESDLKTISFNIYPNYNYDGERKIVGYRAIHSLNLEFSIEEKERIGTVVDSGVEVGVGISSVNFELSPELEQQYKAEAIKVASSDARIKAEALAEGFGKKLGRLVSVSLDGFNYSPWAVYTSEDYAIEEQEAATIKSSLSEITPSEKDVTAYVTATYKLF